MPVKITVPNTKDKNKYKKYNKNITDEDYDILLTINKLKTDLAYLHQTLDYVTEPALIDSYIYEIKSLHMKYQYYLQICKERNITSECVV